MSFLLNQRYQINRLLLALLFAAVLALPVHRVLAQDPNTIIVNRTEDFVDAAPGNGLCDADPNDKVLQCTLRAAIMEANALPDAQTILVPSGGYRLTIAGKDENNSRTGDLDITSDLTILGRGLTQPIIDAAGLDRVFHITQNDGTSVQLENLTLRGGDVRNQLNAGGGGIWIESASKVTMQTSAILDNAAHSGGGIAASRYSIVSVIAVRVQNNLATDLGGGISTATGMTIHNSTVSGNQAGVAGGSGAGLGGGLFAGGNAPIVVEQSTIAGNTALKGGGGIAMPFVNAKLSVTNSTLSGNSAPVGAGIKIEESMVLQHVTIAHNNGSGLHVADANATVTLLNSIIANNGQNCTAVGPEVLLVGEQSLSSDNSCPFLMPGANLSNTNPLLGPLQFNHGETQTHALLPGSPAIDGAHAIDCTPVDQRGVLRPQGAGCDIGAVEATP